jgi:hypothetical protein
MLEGGLGGLSIALAVLEDFGFMRSVYLFLLVGSKK